MGKKPNSSYLTKKIHAGFPQSVQINALWLLCRELSIFSWLCLLTVWFTPRGSSGVTSTAKSRLFICFSVKLHSQALLNIWELSPSHVCSFSSVSISESSKYWHFLSLTLPPQLRPDDFYVWLWCTLKKNTFTLILVSHRALQGLFEIQIIFKRCPQWNNSHSAGTGWKSSFSTWLLP